jgi:hypothetical protein
LLPSSLVAAAVLTAGFASGRALANDKIDPLCTTFVGQMIGTNDGKPVLATCAMIARLEAFENARVSRSPFSPMVDIVDSASVRSFDEFLSSPNNIAYRERCRQDFSFPMGKAGSYTCLTFGVPFHFDLNSRHRVTKLTVTIRSDGGAAGALRSAMERLLMSAPDAIIDHPNQEYIQLIYSAEAVRFNQLARAGENYHVEDRSFVVEVTSSDLRHPVVSLNANGQTSSTAVTNAINSLWNDDDGFGIWIATTPQACAPKFHVGYPFLVVGPPGSHVGYSVGTFDVKTMPLCSYFDEGNVTKCVEGSINYKFDQSSNTFAGTYNVLLEDQRRLTGAFKSLHCARSAT